MGSDPDAAEWFTRLDAATAPAEVVAVGGTLDPRTLVAAYRAGCFPWPSSDDLPGSAGLDRGMLRAVRRGIVTRLAGEDTTTPWCSPDPRAVLLADAVVVRRSLRQRLRNSGWHTTMDRAFEEVVAGCADRPETWITGRMQRAYVALAAADGAHSLEVWDGERLVGGLYGVLTGQVFSGESMFHRESDAAKVAVVDLCSRLLEAGVRLLDTQQATEHMAALGQVVVRRADYVEAVRRLRDAPASLPTDRRPVSRLV